MALPKQTCPHCKESYSVFHTCIIKEREEAYRARAKALSEAAYTDKFSGSYYRPTDSNLGYPSGGTLSIRHQCPACGALHDGFHVCTAPTASKSYGGIGRLDTNSSLPQTEAAVIMNEVRTSKEYLYDALWQRCDWIDKEVDSLNKKLDTLTKTLTELLEVMKGAICH